MLSPSSICGFALYPSRTPEAKVHLFESGEKQNQSVHYRVIDMDTGTYVLSCELKPAPLENMQTGDVNGRKIVMLAQSDMPAQEMHVLKNENDLSLNPCYAVQEQDVLVTTEWTFDRRDLKRFSE